ncbi:GNAT family N-acetyltransferase [Streptomyces sp. ISL-43]|uniref:GNAT family N-acetyltransferase n=1 Tax=Streptomyces sp. ISL-43 TaxID=2819183 RepID=UPI001BEB1E9D|nr:GNAT family N-acetyltransferase [Streptomyces sp. ISL-43]MBT2447975.1 GNAT family N-acetyltransferase [Streptomyces sp. ISL-43]
MERVHGDDAGATAGSVLSDWRYVHNLIIPTHELSLADVRERSGRNALHVAYLGDTLIGCTTVRPPTEGPAPATATVIARVLPAYRGRGFGRELYAYGLAHARELGAEVVETVVLASNPEGLRFSQENGFVEFDRYVLPGDTVPYVELRLA